MFYISLSPCLLANSSTYINIFHDSLYQPPWQ